jgi:hypothetical protein
MRDLHVADDLLPALNRLLVRSLLELGHAGMSDAACRLAGEGWALLRHERPREAERLNGVLHSLTRSECRPSKNHDSRGVL